MRLLIAYLSAILQIGCYSHPATQIPSTSTTDYCKPWAELSLSKGEYLLTNNTWGAKGQKDFEQCISINNNQQHFGWRWKWAGNNGQVLAYPSVLFGHKPWNETSTTSRLPLQIKTLEKMQVTYDIVQSGTGSHNVLLESWVTSSAKPQASTRTAEIAIHLSQQNWPGMPGKLIRTVAIDDELYDFYVDPAIEVPDDNLRWPYLGFVYKGHRTTTGTLDLAAFVRFLTQENYLQAGHYLASIELGSELVTGEGEALIKHFNVQF